MDLSVHAPESGAGGGASARPLYLPPEKAKKFFEAFKAGTFTVIPLGDVEAQRMHFVKPSEEEKRNKIRGHMVLCTASRGSCHHCRARLAGEVLIQESQPYHLGPAYVRKGDRGDFEQKIPTFTDGMWKELCELLGPTGWRGQRFELRRDSTQKYRITPAGKSHTPSGKLPAPFSILPFIRARFELPQDPADPLVFLPGYSHRDLTAVAPGGPRTLALTATDCQKAEDWAKTKAAIAAMKEKTKSFAGDQVPAAVLAPAAPPAPCAAAPAAAKGDVAGGAGEMEHPGDLALAELASDPANYTPPTLAGVGTETRPLIDPPVGDGKLLTRPSVASLAERRKKAAEDNSLAARKAAAEKGAGRLVSSADAIDQVAAVRGLPGANGSAERKGGAA
jgi:hypothetical protein